MRTRRLLVVALVVAAVVSGGMASAYWVVSSIGTGEATGTVAAPETQHITVVLTSDLRNLYPGKTVALAGTFDNPNVPVTVHSVGVTVASTSKSGCAVGNFVLSKPSTVVDAVIPVGAHVGSWDGITLTFRNDPKADQSGCQGATVHLQLTSN